MSARTGSEASDQHRQRRATPHRVGQGADGQQQEEGPVGGPVAASGGARDGGPGEEREGEEAVEGLGVPGVDGAGPRPHLPSPSVSWLPR